MAETSTQTSVLRIGSRGSALALFQAGEVQKRLALACGIPAERIEIMSIRTTGDMIQDRPLADAGGKGLFTKEIEEALLAGTIDLAVHSSKDVPTVLPPGLVLSAFLPREDARDAFVSRKANTLRDLPQGAVVGTSSPRRQALIKHLRPDLVIVPLRGNVETRLRKIEAGGRRNRACCRRAQAPRTACRGYLDIRCRRVPSGGRARRDRYRDA